MLGDRFAELALPLVILAATQDPASAGAVGATVQVPSLLLALWLGGRVDRNSRRWLMLTADLVRAACFVVFAGLAVAHVMHVWPYLVVGLVVGCGNMLFGIAAAAIVPEIFPGQRLVRANALTEAGDALTTVTGPALAGALVARFSAAVALAVDAVTFALSALFLLAVRLPSELSRSALVGAEPPPMQGQPTVEVAATQPPVPEVNELAGKLVGPLVPVFRDPIQRKLQVALTTLNAHGVGIVLAIVVLAASTLRSSAFELA
jgi:MFS family permease